MPITFQINNQHKAAIGYLLRTFGKSYGYDIDLTDGPNGLEIKTTNSFETLVGEKSNFDSHGFILTSDNRPDYLTTAFYLLNCLQEYQATSWDGLGRFPYQQSYQHRFAKTQDNTVQFCFDQLALEYGVNPIKKKTRFFLTHDIDSVYGSILEDGFHVIKKGRFDIFLQMVFRVAMGRPDWLNMDKIMKIESEYDCKSVFYWIVNKGRLNKREVNADYDFNSLKIQDQIKLVSSRGFENGIHKSISHDPFKTELSKFKEQPIGNRYHYLKYRLPDGFDAVEEAGLKLDASLGFAEELGFRNNYGLPYNPYNFKSQKPYSFVEVPLHIMDRTFFQYKKSSVKEAEKEIIDFFEKNKENCVLSVLWHNNFFTEYKFKGYLKLYKSILTYIKENNFNTISQQEIIDKYSL